MGFAVGDAVEWKSSNLAKRGTVAAVVPAGRRPRDVGFPQVGKESSPRDHESYVIVGGKSGREAFWPVVSLVRKSGGLSPAEIAWCNENAEAVRAIMPKRALR